MSDNGIERERKFLVKYLPQGMVEPVRVVQGYFGETPFRVRALLLPGATEVISNNIVVAYLGYKHPVMAAESREERESRIDSKIAEKLLQECKNNVLHKTRYNKYVEGNKWEIDVFHGTHEGLVTAEFEFIHNDDESPELPDFLGREVTLDKEFFNYFLATSNKEKS